MKSVVAALLAALVSAAGWADTLALTLRYENTEPGEATIRWTKEFFTDEAGRLVRIVRTLGSPAGATDIQDFAWSKNRVEWGREFPGLKLRYAFEFTEAGTTYVYSATGENARPAESQGRDALRAEPGEGLGWTDGLYRHSWSASRGYQRTILPGLQGSRRPSVEVSTVGDRYSEWVEGNESTRILLRKTPEALVGTLVALSMDGTTWQPTGKVILSGPGLSTPDRERNWAQFRMADEPLTAGFFFEPHYLK